MNFELFLGVACLLALFRVRETPSAFRDLLPSESSQQTCAAKKQNGTAVFFDITPFAREAGAGFFGLAPWQFDFDRVKVPLQVLTEGKIGLRRRDPKKHAVVVTIP